MQLIGRVEGTGDVLLGQTRLHLRLERVAGYGLPAG